LSWLNTWWSQVSGTVGHGLEITVVGMLLVFFTLGLVIVALILLTRLPGLRVEEKEPAVQDKPAPAVAPPAKAGPAAARTASGQDELAQVAAIAVALLRSRKTRARAFQARPSAWKNYGRAHQHGLWG
jgi:sodium pump decarboxylase gamma subunit